MRAQITSGWLPKDGNRQDQYEDAFWPQARTMHRSVAPFRVAVSDGATESAFSRQWAQLLVLYATSYARDFDTLESGRFLAGLEAYARLWQRFVFNQPLEWFALEKAMKGAFATLTALQISPTGCWTALGVGDSCLFQVNSNTEKTTYPMREASQFSAHPYLLATDQQRNQALFDEPPLSHGTWISGDEFWLMTDAVAHWTFSMLEQGQPPWEMLKQALVAPEMFAAWNDEKRARHEIRNDDVTVLCISVFSDEER